MNAQCPHCHKQQQIPDSYNGREVKCLHCNELFKAAETSRPIDRGMLYALGWAVGKSGEKRLFVKLAILIAAMGFIGFVAFKIGHKQGVKTGFYLAVDTMQSISMMQTNTSSPKMLKPAEYAPLSPCSIRSIDYKTIYQDQTFCQISWQVKCMAIDTGKVNVYVLFYDKDGFLLQREVLYDQFIESSMSYVYSDTAIFSSESAKKISFVDAKIESR